MITVCFSVDSKPIVDEGDQLEVCSKLTCTSNVRTIDFIGILPALCGQKCDRLGSFHLKMVSKYDITLLLCLFHLMSMRQRKPACNDEPRP